jgi:hypothetical protein
MVLWVGCKMGYNIGSLNVVDFFGYNSRDIGILADIIVGESFDIVALQGVCNKISLYYLLRRLPNYWRWYHASPRSKIKEIDYIENIYGFGHPEFDTVHETRDTARGFAFIWNSRRIRECSENGPQIFDQFKYDDFVRKPLYGRFTPSGLSGGAFFELRLINVDLCSPFEDRVRRQREYTVLMDQIYTKVNKKRYGNNMPSYTIILGDYNIPGSFFPSLNQNSEEQVVVTELEGMPSNNLSKDDTMYSSYAYFSYDIRRFSGLVITTKRVDPGPYSLRPNKEYNEIDDDYFPIKMEIALNYDF